MTQHGHQTAPTQFVEVNGIRFAYRRFGKTGGVPLVFSQHYIGTMDYWDPTVTDGLARDREVILFNNAGIGGSCQSRVRFGDVVGTPLKDWNEATAINLNGTFLCCKHVLPVMRKQRSGSVINNSSMGGLVGESGADSCTASNGGVIALTRVMAKDNAQYNIRVNCICPGSIETPMIAPALKADPKLRENLAARVPLRRLGSPEEVANAALFFASEESSYITGAILPVDGGWYAV